MEEWRRRGIGTGKGPRGPGEESGLLSQGLPGRYLRQEGPEADMPAASGFKPGAGGH